MTDKVFVAPLAAYKYAYVYGLKFPKHWHITENFSWNEAFKNELKTDGIPILEVFNNVFDTAVQLQRARTRLKRTFNIHCWVRQVPHNKRAGSSAFLSPHLNGRAVDFSIAGMIPEQARKLLLEMNLPIRIEADTDTWIHVDTGNSYIEGEPRWGLFKP